jgi:hypothetical protein
MKTARETFPAVRRVLRSGVAVSVLGLLLAGGVGCGGEEPPAAVPPPPVADDGESADVTSIGAGYKYIFDMTSPANDNFAITDRAVYLYFWPDTARVNFRLQNRLGTPIKILWDDCRFTTTEGITYTTIHRGVTYEDRNRKQGYHTVLGLEQYTDWVAPSVLLESPQAASGEEMPLLFPTDALAMWYRGRNFYVDFVLEIDNTPVTYRLAFQVRNVSPPE